MGQNWESMSSLIEAREKGAKKAKKGKKKGLGQNKSWNIKTTKPFIKNRLGYGFYKCETISKNILLFLFLGHKWDKMSPFAKFRPFFDFKRACKFLAGKKTIFLIGHRVYLQAHRTLNLYLPYLGKIWKFVRGGEGLPPPYFPNRDYSQKILKRSLNLDPNPTLAPTVWTPNSNSIHIPIFFT